MVVIAVAFLPATQLTRQFSSSQIDAGVEVFAALLGTDHRSVGKHRDLCGLLRNPRIASHGEMDIRFPNRITEVMRCPF